MKIGIVVFTGTGTTYRFARIIEAELTKAGHTIECTLLTTDNPVKSGTIHHHAPFSIINLPDCSGYDVVLIGGPVWAFNCNPVIFEAIRGKAGIRGKKVLPFVTMAFPLKGMGGTRAIKTMSRAATTAGAQLLPGVIVSKMFHDITADMHKAAARISTLLPRQ